MDEQYLDMLHRQLRMRKVQFAPGLSDEEVGEVEMRFSFRFPPDLRFLLQHILPVSQGPPGRSWVNWREEPEDAIRTRLDWPAEGICFDIEHNGFWMDEWGPRPANLEEAFLIARQEVEQAPTLIPIYAHRYLPDDPSLAGNPVFSVWQTDIIHYGFDLASYFAAEFCVDEEMFPDFYIPIPEWAAKSPRPIRFWDHFL
jgi:hypothetical protein